jgi:hypothetical protein
MKDVDHIRRVPSDHNDRRVDFASDYVGHHPGVDHPRPRKIEHASLGPPPACRYYRVM